jgi:hypothetical protein
MLNLVLKEFGSALNGASFAAGAILATGVLISLWIIGGYIKRHYKTVLLLSAAAGGLGLLLLGIRGGF